MDMTRAICRNDIDVVAKLLDEGPPILTSTHAKTHHSTLNVYADKHTSSHALTYTRAHRKFTHTHMLPRNCEGADVNEMNSAGLTLLDLAAERNKIEIVALLAGRGAKHADNTEYLEAPEVCALMCARVDAFVRCAFGSCKIYRCFVLGSMSNFWIRSS